MKCSFFLLFGLINLSESLTRQEREQRRAQRRKNKKEKQDNKAASLGYNDSNELIHSNKEGQISPFLQYVYGIKSTTKKTTSTTTSTTTTEETTTEQTTTSAQTTTVPTTTSAEETTTVDIRDLSPAERKARRKAQRLKAKLEREKASTSRPKTTKKPYNKLSDTLNDVQNIIFSAIWKNKFSNSFVLPPMPEFPVTTEDPSFGARIIPRIQQDEFNVPNKETLDLIVNFEESNSSRFNRRREFETSALPKCNGEQLQLNLECEGCSLGFPKIDLCARFSSEGSGRIREESEFKCKIDCGPGFKIAEGFNKVKCTKEKWKHMKKDVTEKTCVPIY